MRKLLGPLVLALLPASSFASILTYDFLYTATSGGLAGTASAGTFSFDSSLATPFAQHNQVGLLSGLSFTWDGISYSAATANSGWLDFGAAGQLTSFAFGTNCGPGSCSVTSGTHQWYAFDGAQFNGGLAYGQPGGIGFGVVSSSFRPGRAVPEPAPLALFGCALVLLGVLRQKIIRRDETQH